MWFSVPSKGQRCQDGCLLLGGANLRVRVPSSGAWCEFVTVFYLFSQIEQCLLSLPPSLHKQWGISVLRCPLCILISLNILQTPSPIYTRWIDQMEAMSLYRWFQLASWNRWQFTLYSAPFYSPNSNVRQRFESCKISYRTQSMLALLWNGAVEWRFT